MNDFIHGPHVQAEIVHRARECRRAMVLGFTGRLRNERGHLVARVDAARRQMARYGDHTAEVELVMAEAALERFDEMDMEIA